MMDFILQLTPGYLYPALFIGISFLGGIILLPAIYLTIIGTVKITHLFVVVVLAGINSDTLWYIVGRKAKKDHLYRLPFFKKRIQDAQRFSDFFSKHSLWLLYVTKFIYGTRVASHVLAGMHRVRYASFLIATALGTATWFWLFYFIVRGLDYGIGAAKSTALRIQLTLLVGVLVLLALNWFTGKYVKNKLFKPNKSKTEK